MRQIIFICFLLYESAALLAQIEPPTVTVGSVLTDPEKSSLSLGRMDLLGLYQDKLYAYDHSSDNKRRTIVLDFYIYDEDLAIETKQQLKITGSLKYRYESLMMLEERTYLVLSSQERRTNSKIILVQEIDLGKMKSVGSMREIAKIPFLSGSSWMDVQFELSLKKQKVLLWCYSSVNSVLNPQMVRVINTSYLYAFDNTFSPLWQYEVQLPKKVKSAYFLPPSINDNGVAVLARERKTYERNILTKQEIRVFTIEDGKAKQTIELDREDVWVQQFSCKIKLSGELMLAGFYGKEPEKRQGYFYETYAPSESIPHLSYFNLFDLSSAKLPKEHLNIQKHLDGDRLTIRDMILKNSGGLMMVAQFGLITYHTDQSGTRTSTFVYGDMLLLNIESDGELAWAERIFQPRSAFPNGWVLQSNQINFFFSQSEDEEIRKTLTVGSYKNLSAEVLSSMQVEMTSVGLNGEQSSQVIVPSNGLGHRLYPVDRFLRAGETVIIKGLEGRSAHYIKLDY